MLSLHATAAAAQQETAADKPDLPNATIVVIAPKPQVQRTIEGTTYDVRDNPAGQAGTAADVLNTIPSVNVSPDGGVTVRGNGNVQIYVDGRPSAAMNGDSRATTLQAISGGSIASVEVITNPSAKYSANGGAIVNLVTKKGSGEGAHVTATVNAGDHARANATLNGSYGGKKLSASLNVSLRDNVRFTHIDDDRQLFTLEGTPTARFHTESEYTPTHARSANLSGSLHYTLSPTAEIGTDLSWSSGSPYNTVYERHLDENAVQGVTAYTRVRGGTYVNENQDYSLYYSDQRDDGRSLKLQTEHSQSALRNDRLYIKTYTVPALPPVGEQVFNGPLSRIDRVALDYARPIHSRLQLSLGGEWKRELTRYDNGRGTYNPSLGPPAMLEIARFDAVQKIAAAYATLQFRSGPWTLLAGERFEDLGVSMALSPENYQSQRHFDWLNHSLSIARELGDDHVTLRLSNARQRLDPNDLNPRRVYIDAQNLSMGNPLLSPQEVTSAEAEYDLKRGALDAAATLYYRRTDAMVVDDTTLLADNVVLTTKRNAGHSAAYGGQLTLSDRLGKDVRYSVTGNLFRSELSGAGLARNRTASLLSYALQGSLDWSATKKDKLRIDGNLQGPSLILNGSRTGTGTLNLVWRHTLNPRLTASLTAQGIAQKIRVRTVIEDARSTVVNERESGGRAVFVGVSYKIR